MLKIKVFRINSLFTVKEYSLVSHIRNEEFRFCDIGDTSIKSHLSRPVFGVLNIMCISILPEKACVKNQCINNGQYEEEESSN